jgi:hypothetical protein
MYDHFMNDGPTARGNRFNRSAKENKWHDFDEVYLENIKRVDSYDLPKKNNDGTIKTNGKIVSRKAIDLDIINEKLFKQYLNEFKFKYQEGRIIKTKKDGYEQLFNQPLKGDYILEIPESNKLSANLDTFVKLAKDNYVKIEFRPE